MEFSFDRSKQSNSQSQQTKTSNSEENLDTSNIANERLRKAIERNRSRQKEREQQQAQTSTLHGSAWAQHQAQTQSSNVQEELHEEPREEPARQHQQASFFDQRSRAENRQEEIKVEPRVQVRTNMRREATPVASRKSVGRPDETEFAPVKRTAKKAASQISYTTGSRKKSKELDPKLINYLVKGSWIFCGFLVLRLIFANGGLVSYFSQKSILNERFSELSRIKSENMSLVNEIERMQTDVAYQKRLVRDNLGFIAHDEFLVLFPQE